MAADDPATLQAVAAAAGLSVATVSKILGGKYKGNTPKGRERSTRVLAIAKRLGFIANASARRLRSGAHQAVIVFLMVDDFGHPPIFSVDFLLGINQSLRAHGKAVIVHTVVRPNSQQSGQETGQQVTSQMPTDRTFDGALVVDQLVPEVEAFLAQVGVPVGYINSDPGPGRQSSQRDERAAGSDLVTTLAGLGYRHIVALGETGDQTTSVGGHIAYPQRWAGICAAAQAAGLRVTSLPDPWWSGNFTQTIARVPVAEDTVVVAMDVNTVLMFLRFGSRDVALACCDDSHLFSDIHPLLTRVRFDRVALGRQAADLLLAQMAGQTAPPAPVPLMRGMVMVGNTTPAR